MQELLHRREIEQLPEVLAREGRDNYYPQALTTSSLILTLKGLSLMKITSPKFHRAYLSPNEEALLRCQTALELKDRGDYRGAREALGDVWKRVGDRPQTSGLH